MLFSKKTLSLALALAAVGGISLFAMQSAEARGINFRQHNEKSRIFHGVKTGQLSRPEARRLIGQQRYIQHVENRYRADGHLSPRERVRISMLQNRANHSIFNQKHDRQFYR